MLVARLELVTCPLLLARSLLVALVQRLASKFLAFAAPQLDLEQVIQVIVGRDQGEALLDQLALVDRRAPQLGGHYPSRPHERAPPNERHRGERTVLPVPGPDHLVAHVQLPIWVALGR